MNRPSTDPSATIGIDLGTTMSAVASVDPSGVPFSITNADGDLLTPTAVLIDEEIVVGREAVGASVMEPDAYAECFKRDVGAPVFHHGLCGVEIPPQVLSAFVLDQLLRDAERRLGPVNRAVITVPAFFDEGRRKATQDAGQLAGLEVLDIINEPTAAALAYGYQSGFFRADPDRQSRRILVYDLGGGTFDVTILEINGNEYRAVATDGDVQLGGKDFDGRLVDYLADQFIRQHGCDPRDEPHDALQLLIDAQRIKHTLSARSKTSAVIHHNGLRSNVVVTRELFEELTCDLLQRTETTTSLVVREAGLSWDQIDRALLVGGSSRMPAVSEMLAAVSGRPIDRSLSPDEAVAHGAALHAAMLTGSGGETLAQCRLINVNSHSLGVRGIDNQTRRAVNGIMIPKNTPLPCQIQKRFTTIQPDQRSVRVVVLEGESGRPEDCIELGDCVIRGLPPGLPAGSPIEVTYRYGADGRVAVTARVVETRQSASVAIRRHNTAELENLDAWRQRLLAPRPSEDQTSAADEVPLDPGTVLRRLDELYFQIGRAAVAAAASPAIMRPHSAVVAAIATMREAKSVYQTALAARSSATTDSDKVRASTQVVRCKERLEKATTQAKFACIVLGRECVKQGQVPDQMVTTAEEVKRLRGALV